MSYDKVKQAEHLKIGIKETTLAVEHDKAKEVVVAQDAEQRVTVHLLALCARKGVPVSYVDSMRKLGQACGIEVGASAVAILK